MRRSLFVCVVSLLAAMRFGPVPALSRGPAEDTVPNELPRSWDIKEIEKAAPPYGDGGGDRVFVLAWKIIEDDRPLRVETCLVLKELGAESKTGRWCLSHLYRHPLDKDNTWRLPPIWVSPPPPLGPEKAVAIDHLKRFKEKPGNKLIYDSLKEVQWSFTLDDDWKLVSCGVCERAWEASIGEKPSRFFGK